VTIRGKRTNRRRQEEEHERAGLGEGRPVTRQRGMGLGG